MWYLDLSIFSSCHSIGVGIANVFEGVGPMLGETNLANPDSLNFFWKMKLNNHFYTKLCDILYECVRCSPSSHIVKWKIHHISEQWLYESIKYFIFTINQWVPSKCSSQHLANRSRIKWVSYIRTAARPRIETIRFESTSLHLITPANEVAGS